MTHPILAIHVTPYRGRRAVLTGRWEQNSLRCAGRRCACRWLPYITDHAQHHPNLKLVVSPGDPWPPHLQRAIEDTGLPMRWVTADFERTAYQAVRPWRANRRLYRARFLAFMHLAAQRRLHGYEVGIQWERYLAMETLDALDKGQANTDVDF